MTAHTIIKPSSAVTASVLHRAQFLAGLHVSLPLSERLDGSQEPIVHLELFVPPQHLLIRKEQLFIFPTSNAVGVVVDIAPDVFVGIMRCCAPSSR